MTETSSPVPDGWAELTRRYAEHFPAGTHGLVVARGFGEVSDSFQTVKVHIRSFFDLAAVESEIRNTFGVDLNRHVTFREVGLAYEGGFALSTVMQQPVLAFYVLDPEPLIQRANEVLRRQPFNLRAPVRKETVEQGEIYLYARRANQPVEFAVLVDRGFGFLISRASNATDVEEVARLLARTRPEESLAAHPDFDHQVERFDEFPGFLFIDTRAVSTFYRERYSDQLSATSTHALNQVEGAIQSLAGGARLDDLELSFQAFATVTPEVREVSAGIDEIAESHPRLERFVLPSTFATVRLGTNPRILLETFLRFQGPNLNRLIREGLERFGETLGASIVDEVFPLLTGHALIMINRLAPISIMRAETAADYADAVDLMAVFQLRDAERAREIMDGLVARSEGAYERIEMEGVVRYATGRGQHGFGNIYIRDDLLILAADRMRRIAARTPPEGTGQGVGSLVPAARELVSEERATGAFLNFERLEPIVTLLNYPQVVRDLLSFLDTLVVRLEATEEGLLVRGSLTLKPTD